MPEQQQVPPQIPPEQNSQDPTFGMPPAFRHLWRLELGLVWFIGFGAILLIGYSALWVVFGFCPKIHDRLLGAVNGLNAVWKIGLLVLIPLFFRPIFKFLINLKEGPFGTKIVEPKGKEVEEKPYTPTEGQSPPL